MGMKHKMNYNVILGFSVALIITPIFLNLTDVFLKKNDSVFIIRIWWENYDVMCNN